MDITEIYFLLFTDTLVSNLVFSFYREMAINSMKVFGTYNSYLVVSVATTSFAIASYVNYVFGVLCYKILVPFSSEELELSKNRIERLRSSKYLFLFLLLSAVPFFGKFIVLLAGFCRINIKLTMAFAVCAKLVYYSFFMII